MTIARLAGESDAYAKLRDELQEAEIALRDQRERVAELRRHLPQDHQISDETFEEIRGGVRTPVKLSELFEDPGKPLILMQFMFGKGQKSPCPMCTAWADGYDATQAHLRERVNFAVLVAGDVGDFNAHARSRGWNSLRLVSAANSDLKRRLGFENEDGGQLPGVSVILRKADGELTHFYSQSAILGEAGGRGMDLLMNAWSYFDLTPDGRGEFFPSLQY